MPGSEHRTPPLDARFFLAPQGWPYLLVPFIPVAIVLDIVDASEVLIFVCSALGIIPTAALMGRATEELAARSGPGIGGLLNVTFGNAPELIIALFALGHGLHEVVKASLIGSILGNLLLVMGASMLVGGLGRERQRFNSTAACVQTSMLLLAAVASSCRRCSSSSTATGSRASASRGLLRLDDRAALWARRRRPDPHLRRRAGLLAQDAQGHLQPRLRGRGDAGAGHAGCRSQCWRSPAWRWA